LSAVPRFVVSPDWPDSVQVINPDSLSPLVLICDHASNHIPAAYDRLGVEASELERHIAYDVGAAELTAKLAARLGAPAFLGGYSRLLVDLNRPFGSPTSMPILSEATRIPGNETLDEAEKDFRRGQIFEPFHAAISNFLDGRKSPSLIVAIHSFTPMFLGVARPWHIGILHDDLPDFANAFLAPLRAEPGLIADENVPYVIERESDYAIPIHGTDRGNPAVLIEVRNDLIGAPAGVAEWTDRLAPILERLVIAQETKSISRI
jgi:predicted N-formylglutamate amidohydrolase